MCLKQMEAGPKPADLRREICAREGTLDACKSTLGGLELSKARRLRELG